MNDNIIKQFENLIKQIEFDILFSSTSDKLKNSFRLKHIKNSLKIITNYKEKIIEGKQLKDVKGIGKGTIKRIDEILKTGKLKEITFTKKIDDILKTIRVFKKIYGIGEKKAYELIKEQKIKSIDDLKKKISSKKIIIPENISIGLKYLDVYKENIPRREMTDHETILLNTLKEMSSKFFGIVCGSYRRKKPTSNDIDFMFVQKEIKTKKAMENVNYLNQFIEKLIEKKYIVDSLTSTFVITKYMGFCKITKNIRRIDIRFMPYNSFYSALLYFTGSGEFNRKMRLIAKSYGYKLNEYGLFKNKKSLLIKSEKDIFDKLNMEYIQPEDRN
jgi:DNA polymerase/3'-5' exonuclease PolX